MIIEKNLNWIFANQGKLALRNGRLIGRVIGYGNKSEQVLLEHAGEPIAYPDRDVPIVTSQATWLIKNCSSGVLYDISTLVIFDPETNKQLKLKEIAWLEDKLSHMISETISSAMHNSAKMIDKIEIRLEELILSGNEVYHPSDLYLIESAQKSVGWPTPAKVKITTF